jgi:thymidylate synthase
MYNEQLNLNVVGNFSGDVWKELLRQIWEFGQIIPVMYSGKSVNTVELIGMRSQIKNPTECNQPVGYIWKPDSSSWDNYREEFMNSFNPGFEYTYGERLRSWGYKGNQVDQLYYVVRELNRDRASRRALGVTWIPTIDEETESPPCLMCFQTLIRNEKLDAIAVYRSHDIFGAYPANIYGLVGLMEYVADLMNVDVGSLTFFSHSAHIYWFNWPDAARVLGDGSVVPRNYDRNRR